MKKISQLLILVVTFLCIQTKAEILTFRTTSDIKRDKTSLPAQVIQFAGVKEGQQVLDLLAGGGYYTELLAKKVGKNGHVVLHNNQAYMPYIGKELSARLENNRLVNVSTLMSEASSLNLGEEKYDLVFLVLGYHDFFVKDKNWDFPAKQVVPQIYRALKKNGRLLVIDHVAQEDIGARDAQKLHRIEPKFVKKDLSTYGFHFIKSTDILKNPDDPLNISVFDPKIRRKTERFVFLFQKASKD
ncbi:class I SAM-dependent methyltransferase [Aliikangiella sp. IMCC44359]|uniref:class I SAM-dependent methyltransferase n=1 Tax=Aliikangiella sp. IMCC44359 TaxID=3459125 RepID=UPI00403B2D6B